jgi:hypothetical protein
VEVMVEMRMFVYCNPLLCLVFKVVSQSFTVEWTTWKLAELMVEMIQAS